MKRIAVLLLASFICLVNLGFAQKIKIKKSFFGDWKYSLDDDKYQNVGFTGGRLYNDMGGNDAALHEMSKYKSNKTIALITGVPGGFMVGWAAGSAIAGNYKDSDKTLLLIGAPLSVISIVFGIISDGNIKKAVRIYNGEEETSHLDINLNKKLAYGSELISLDLSYSF